MKNTVLLVHPTIRPVGVKYLEENCDVVYAPNGDEETLIEYINLSKARAVITRTEYITENIVRNCPSLEFVGQHGVGLDNIDLDACRKYDVSVINVPDANYVSVAEHAILLILALSKNLIRNDQEVRGGNWDYRDQSLPTEISDKNLLVIGFGRNGKETARKAHFGFDMNVLGFDPFVSDGDMRVFGARKIEDLHEGLSEADFISIHVPLVPQTKHLISVEEFNVMKETAYLVNVSRGSIVDTIALYEALSEGKIKGAGLDVLESEPPDLNNPLLTCENVMLTPHIGGDTRESKDRCSLSLARNITTALNGGVPKNLVRG